MALFLTYGLFMGATFYYLSIVKTQEPEKWPTWKPLIYELTFRNVMELREQLSTSIGWLPEIWAYMMKQFIPHVILILFINLAQSSTGTVGEPLFGNYGGYANWPFQIMGYGTTLFAFGLFVIGFVAPDLYKGLTLLDEKALIHGYGQGAQKKELEKLGGGEASDESEKAEDEETPAKVDEAEA